MTKHADDGFSLIEVVIAMFLFAVISLAILPLAIQAAALSTVNRDEAAANAFASSQLAVIRSSYPDDGTNACSGVRAKQFTQKKDPAETGLTANLVVSACPTSYPGVVTITAKVFDPAESTTDPVVTMATQVIVTAAS
ncbi:prepilin-type N-terminal cleavage/methylation domain-containing protein [Microbacterium fluvii]|uniref:Prepilin-type N-terminal cleavage/methylation domain-containing protein n=1 Tax=Microbacterium fluvii TaxID=415215 RepID=A0ABW2HFV0_9MICO|nr:prepilin-type N-terminal cleavage/methylation domain-containing protein [Microbacterium fluvii]MCU4673597.1 prepilin-type N-terminal cleavage/methylation domain-containing protein [Microbacterium fluvii]